MALTDAFPGAPGVADSVDLRKGLAGLIVRDTAGVPRSGIFPRHTGPLVDARTDMSLNVQAFEGVSVRGGGPLFMANDGSAVSPTLPIPVANSQISVLYFKQNENGYNGFADGLNTPVFGVETGTAGASPTKPSIAGIAGATELATITIPSTATATNSSGVVITQTFQYTTTSGGVLWFRTTTERDAFAGVEGQLARIIGGKHIYALDGAVWGSVASLKPVCRVLKSSAQNTASTSAVYEPVAFNLESNDIYGMHNPVTNNSRINIPAGFTGLWQVDAHLEGASTSAMLGIVVYVNGFEVRPTRMNFPSTAANFAYPVVSAVLPLNAGDYVEIFSVSNLATVSLTVSGCVFALTFVS